MREHPILFNGDMIRAYMAGRKTQTRRLVKFQKLHADFGEPCPDDAWVDDSYMTPELGMVPCLKVPYGNDDCLAGRTCHRHFPKWEPGDRLWVRETWNSWVWDGVEDAPYLWSDTTKAERDGGRFGTPEEWVRQDRAYKATDEPLDPDIDGRLWVPSIHMPRWACRHTPDVLSVRVERVQDISEENAMAEGCECRSWESELHNKCWDADTYVTKVFSGRWDSLYGKKPGQSWADNPWVQAAKFPPYAP